MVDPKAADFFQQEREREPENRRCADTGVDGAEWASISHGIYLSIGASGVHRSLGVKVSYVQSTTMDSWKPIHLRMMELGGNARFARFLEEQGIPKGMPPRQKYRTRAAAWYRQNLKAMAEGSPPLDPLAPGEGGLPDEEFADEAPNILDQVFAGVPSSALTMTAGGVPLEAMRQGYLGTSKSASSRLPQKPHHNHHPQHTAPHQSSHVLHPSNPLHQHRLPHAGHPHKQPFAHELSNLHPKSRKAKGAGGGGGGGGSGDSLLLSSWVAKNFKNLTTAKGVRVAEKLKKMSTGKMAGFGSEASAGASSTTPTTSSISIGPGRMIGFGPEAARLSTSTSTSSSMPVSSAAGSPPTPSSPSSPPPPSPPSEPLEMGTTVASPSPSPSPSASRAAGSRAAPPAQEERLDQGEASSHKHKEQQQEQHQHQHQHQQQQQQQQQPEPAGGHETSHPKQCCSQSGLCQDIEKGQTCESDEVVARAEKGVPKDHSFEEALEVEEVEVREGAAATGCFAESPKIPNANHERNEHEAEERKDDRVPDLVDASDSRSDSGEQFSKPSDQDENADQAPVEQLKCEGFESQHDQSETTDGLRDEESDHIILDEH